MTTIAAQKKTTNDKLKELWGNMSARASSFSQQKGLFSGSLIDEELTHWAKKLWEIIDEP